MVKESVPLSTERQASLFEAWDRHKSAELHDTRQHRDAALAQRERYGAANPADDVARSVSRSCDGGGS